MSDNGGPAFPVLGFRLYRDELLTVPWDFIAPHEAQARNNHGGQTLKRLAERGGLCPLEMLDVIQGREWKSNMRTGVDEAMAWGQIQRELAHWLAEKSRRESTKGGE